MIKLKNIINEIILMSGDAGIASDSAALMDDFSAETRGFEKLVKRIYGNDSTSTFWNKEAYWLNRADVKGKPLDARLTDYIKANAFDSQGNYYIIRTKVDDRFWHNLFDLSRPAEVAYIGRIETNPSVGEYSMKRIYGVDGQVVHWSNIAKEYKGAGFGAFLYDTLLYKYGVLESDTILYKGSLTMWSRHLPKVSTFFGGTIGDYGGTQSRSQVVVIPLTGEDVQDKKFISDVLGSFVAFHDNVPAGIKQIARLTKGLSFRTGTLGVVHIDLKINAAPPKHYDWRGVELTPDDASSFLDLFDTVSYEELLTAIGEDVHSNIIAHDSLARAQKIIMLFLDATVVVEPKGDGIKYELIQ